MLNHVIERNSGTEPGFTSKTILWALDFSSDGAYLGLLPLGDQSDKKNRGREFYKCPNLKQTELITGGETRSQFLVESAKCVAMLDVGEDEQNKMEAKHNHYLKLLEMAAVAIPAFKSIAAELQKPEVLDLIRQQMKAHKVKPTDRITLRIGKDYPVDSDAWHNWWRQYRNSLPANQKAASTSLMRCVVTGDLISPVMISPKIKGLAGVGGATAGDSLVSFDKEAFTSYYLSQSANAAMSEETATAYSESLNDLIAKHSTNLASAKVVHWFKNAIPEDDDPFALLETGGEQQELDAQHRAEALLQSIKTGKRPDLAGNRYYAMTLSGQSGRVMVRDWMEGQFEELAGNINQWFDDLRIVHRSGGTMARDPKFLAVVGATVRELKDAPSPMIAHLWKTAVRNLPLPHYFLAKALERLKADLVDNDEGNRVPNHARMGLLKLYHLRKDRIEGGKHMGELKPLLNEHHPSPAYQCGRLMAAFGQLQQSAMGDVGVGVVERYYAAASATPALVLGRLARNSQYHLNKLAGDKRGLARWYEGLIADIVSKIGDRVPQTLTLEEQSLFALGYYQQIAQMRAGKSGQNTEENNG